VALVAGTLIGQDGGVVTVRYFAAARAAAGVAEEKVSAPTLEALLADISAVRGAQLARVLGVATFLVDGVACRDRTSRLPPDATIDVLPPFAGG
jgi:molybdopterin synthase sulfur carrier subunit